MIAEKQTVSLQEIQDLQQQILEAEKNLVRLAAKLEEIKSGAAAVAAQLQGVNNGAGAAHPTAAAAGSTGGAATVTFEEAAGQVRTDYSHLLQRLSQ